MIAWCSLERADIDNAGRVRFEPARGGRGTVVWVEMDYQPLAGRLGEQERCPGRARPRPKNPQSPRRHRPGHLDRHLWFRPASSGRKRIRKGDIDPGFIFTHRLRLEDAPLGYDLFKHKQDGCIKVVLKP